MTKTDQIRRFLERHAYSIPETKNADEMLAVLDDVDAETRAANTRAQDMANLLADERRRLRDTFAVAALARIPYGPSDSDTNVAVRAYRQADAMLAARKGK